MRYIPLIRRVFPKYRSFKDNGVKAIEMLMEKKGKFDYILLETTGIADPGLVKLLTFILFIES